MVNPLLYTIILIVIGIFLAINIYTQNFLASYIQVKIRRDAGVMMQILGKRGFYFRPGKLSSTDIKFKYDRKTKATILTEHAHIFRALGVAWIINQEGSDKCITKKGLEQDKTEKSVFITWIGERGADPVEYDYRIEREIHRPDIASTRENLIMLALIVIFVITLFTLWKVMDIQAITEAGTTIAASTGNI